jgi:hypothetical protein
MGNRRVEMWSRAMPDPVPIPKCRECKQCGKLMWYCDNTEDPKFPKKVYVCESNSKHLEAVYDRIHDEGEV